MVKIQNSILLSGCGFLVPVHCMALHAEIWKKPVGKGRGTEPRLQVMRGTGCDTS